MAQNVKMKQILQSAFFLMAVTNIIFYLLSLGYMLITPKVLYIHFAVMLYNVGVNSWVIFALGLNSKKAIDLERGAMFNYQGMSASNWLITFPILFGPLAVYGILAFAFGNVPAIIVLGALGLVGIILHPRLIDYFTKQYLKRKHKMIAGYKTT
jgi:magnesium-transporting ATPase (P-type)